MHRPSFVIVDGCHCRFPHDARPRLAYCGAIGRFSYRHRNTYHDTLQHTPVGTLTGRRIVT